MSQSSIIKALKDGILFIYFWERVFPCLMFSAKQGNYWYHFYNIFGMTWSLTGDWTRDLPHSKPALLPLGYWGGICVGNTSRLFLTRVKKQVWKKQAWTRQDRALLIRYSKLLDQQNSQGYSSFMIFAYL